jgi:cell division protein FtsZ
MKKKAKQIKKEPTETFAKIKVVGFGGAGGNILSRMNRGQLRGVDFIVMNTDVQDLHKTGIREKIHIGKNISKGLGAGMNPDIGRQAAEESRPQIEEALRGADMVFLAAGMGGGTGTGAISIAAEIARDLGILTVAVVTKPFFFEGSRRAQIAEEGLVKLRDRVDAYLVVPNDRIFNIIDQNTPLNEAFEAIDEILKHSVRGVAELINVPGIINTDFADIKTVLQEAGMALIGIGKASGADRAVNAVKAAVGSPLFEISPSGARGVLFSVMGNDLKMVEINEAAKYVGELVDPSAKIIFGAMEDNRLKKGEIKVMVIAAGFNGLVKYNNEKQQAIFNEKEKIEKIEKSPFISKKEEQQKKVNDDTLEVPAFLRRKK